jgi:hypothetical protein
VFPSEDVLVIILTWCSLAMRDEGISIAFLSQGSLKLQHAVISPRVRLLAAVPVGATDGLSNTHPLGDSQDHI